MFNPLNLSVRRIISRPGFPSKALPLWQRNDPKRGSVANFLAVTINLGVVSVAHRLDAQSVISDIGYSFPEISVKYEHRCGGLETSLDQGTLDIRLFHMLK